MLKLFVERPRPPLLFRMVGASGTSFPSSHTTMSLATYGAITYLFLRGRKKKSKGVAPRVWAPVLFFCGLVDWSRVYLRVHHPSDVLGGWRASAIWLTTCAFARTLMTASE